MSASAAQKSNDALGVTPALTDPEVVVEDTTEQPAPETAIPQTPDQTGKQPPTSKGAPKKPRVAALHSERVDPAGKLNFSLLFDDEDDGMAFLAYIPFDDRKEDDFIIKAATALADKQRHAAKVRAEKTADENARALQQSTAMVGDLAIGMLGQFIPMSVRQEAMKTTKAQLSMLAVIFASYSMEKTALSMSKIRLLVRRVALLEKLLLLPDTKAIPYLCGADNHAHDTHHPALRFLEVLGLLLAGLGDFAAGKN